MADLLTQPIVIGAWILAVVCSVGVLIVDLRRVASGLPPLMKVVWILTVIYSGPVGLGAYWSSGRPRISQDSLARRALRSDAHCFSGCGGGEVIGVLVAAGILGLGNVGISVITFVLAFVFGLLLTIGPMVQSGMALGTAAHDALISESASISVMEISAIGVDLAVARNATIGDPLFWASLVFSLLCGFAAAYPVNLLLVTFGIKEGMSNPQEMALD